MLIYWDVCVIIMSNVKNILERNNDMKKIIATILCAGLIVLTAAGCNYSDALAENSANATQSSQTSDSQTEEKKVTDEDFEDNLDGLCNYFAAKEYIETKDDKINESKMTKMDASLIGAKEGKKFVIPFGKNVTLELYEYDTKNLNDKAKEIIASVEETGKFTILDLPEVEAYMSDSGKYLMIYTDASIDKKNPDKESNNYLHREDIIKDFKAFKA